MRTDYLLLIYTLPAEMAVLGFTVILYLIL